jgi:hypothetical protein
LPALAPEEVTMAVTSNDPVALSPFASTDEYHVVLVNASRFDRLLRKVDLLDESVAAVFGLAGAQAELLSLSFHAAKFTPNQVAAWLAERKSTPLADVPILRSICPLELSQNGTGKRVHKEGRNHAGADQTNR